MFHTATTLACLYVLLRFVRPLPLHWALRAALALALAFAAKFHHISALLFGTMFSPEWPRPLALALGWGFAFFIALLLGTLALDLAGLARWLLNRLAGQRAAPMPHAQRWRAGIAAVAALVAGVGVANAVRVPPVKRIEVPIARLPAAFDGLRIVQLTDLHISRLFDARWAQTVVERANDLQPDLTVITGDLIDGTPADRAADVAPLAALRARHGVWAIPGNHEYYFDYAQWRPVFQSLGLRMLDNAHATIALDGGATPGLTLAGITDPASRHAGMPQPDLAAALQGARPDLPIVLLAHRPEDAPLHARAGVALQLSGHTHGGMVPGLDWLVRRANGGFDSGRYAVGGMTLYLSNGTGLWMGFPVRLGVPSEITEITLRSAP